MVADMNVTLPKLTVAELGIAQDVAVATYQLRIDKVLDELHRQRVENRVNDKKVWHSMIKQAMAALSKELPTSTNLSALAEFAWQLANIDLRLQAAAPGKVDTIKVVAAPHMVKTPEQKAKHVA